MNIQAVYNKLSVNYIPVSLTIFVIVFIINLAFSIKEKWLPFDLGTLITSITMSILIGYELSLIIKIISNIDPTFQEICPLFQNNNCKTFLDDLKFKMKRFWLICSTIVCVIIPFVVLKICRLWNWEISKGMTNEIPPYFYLLDHTTHSLLLDIFNELTGYFIIFLLGIIVWIIIQITFRIIELQKKYELKINLFNVKEIGGLEPLNNFVLFIFVNYVIIISLIIFSYTPPNEMIYYHIYSKLLITPEIVILILMLFIGVNLFIVTQVSIQRIIDKSTKPELEKIYKNYIETYNKTFEICSDSRINGKIKELKELQVTIDLLEKEEMRIKQIQNKKFDLKTLITIFTTVLLPIISIISK